MRPQLIRLLSLVVMLGAVPPAPASAASHAPAAPAAQYVDLAPVALPVIHQGRLLNYVFVAVRLNLAANADVAAVRAKEAYFRDALVKAAHRRPFTRLDDFATLDEARIKAALAPEAARIAGAGRITGVEVREQSAQRRYGLPRPPQARAPAAAQAH
jgi:hypothetical protein